MPLRIQALASVCADSKPHCRCPSADVIFLISILIFTFFIYFFKATGHFTYHRSTVCRRLPGTLFFYPPSLPVAVLTWIQELYTHCNNAIVVFRNVFVHMKSRYVFFALSLGYSIPGFF